MRHSASRQLAPNLRFGQATHLPCPIEMFKALAGKALFGQVSENQVVFRERSVLAQVPCFADREIAKQIVRGIGFEWNRDEGVEQLACLAEMRIPSGEIEETELAEFPEEQQIVVQVMNKRGEVRFGPLDEAECHNRRSGIPGLEKHWKAVDEVADCRLDGTAALIRPGREMLQPDF